MKFNKSRQLLLVSAASLLVAGALTACGTLTVDFVYVTSAKAAGPNSYGEVDVFEINSESGFMRQIPTSPFPSGGRNPVASVASPDFSNLYVVNQDDNTIVQFAIGNDGKLYPQNTLNTPGVDPMAVAVAGSYLYVLDTYQPPCSPSVPCSGAVAVYPIQPASGTGDNAVPAGKLGPAVANGTSYCQGTIAATNFWPLLNGCSDVMQPTGIVALTAGSTTYIYISAFDTTNQTGYIFGFSSGSNGALVPLNNGIPFSAGTHPSALAAVGGQYLYAADSTQRNVLAFTVSSTTGALTALGTAPAGGQPSALVADASGKYLYVANYADSNVMAYSISGGVLKSLGTYATGLQPIAIGIDPNMHQFLYTANFTGNSVSGFELSATDGTLINSQNTPYTANANPTSVAAIPHNGNKQ